MSELEFARWFDTSKFFGQPRLKNAARAAYQAGRESLLGALLEMVEEDKERVASAFYSDATQEVIDSLIANNTAVAAAGR